MKKLLLISCIAQVLVGCQTSHVVDANTMGTAPLEILAEESQKAVLAQQSLKTARLEEMKTLQVRQSKFNVDVLNANYIGTPEVFLNSIANHFGYRYLEVGKKKTLPIINFTNRKETGFELIKDTAIFVDGYADIVVDNQNKTISLAYKN